MSEPVHHRRKTEFGSLDDIPKIPMKPVDPNRLYTLEELEAKRQEYKDEDEFSVVWSTGGELNTLLRTLDATTSALVTIVNVLGPYPLKCSQINCAGCQVERSMALEAAKDVLSRMGKEYPE